MNTSSRHRSERGSAMLEFALVGLAMIPLLFGTVALGINLGNGIQAVQVARDIGHMYARGIDFSVAANQSIANRLAPNFPLTPTGKGVAILSQVIRVYQEDCLAAGLPANCGNVNRNVLTSRIIFGNTGLRGSNYGAPNPAFLSSQGNISSSNYLQDGSCIAGQFESLHQSQLNQQQGDVAYVVEVFFATPDLAFLGSAFANGSGGIYARAIF